MSYFAPASPRASPRSARRRLDRDDYALGLLLIALAAWGSWLIARTSFVVEDRRWFTLFDDPMISMTYVRHWLAGQGLVWTRQAEPVEGFTDPLWLLVMVPSHLLPIAARFRSLPVQAISLSMLLASVVAVRSLMLSHFTKPSVRHWMPAAVLTAFYYPLAYWTVMGMETGLQCLLTLVCVKLALDAVYHGRDRHLAVWLACAAAYLLRMDMAIVVAAVQVFLLAMGGLRRPGVRSWLLGLAVFLAAAAGYELFRWVYFHDWLPNTYYLKVSGIPLEVRLLRGWDCLLTFARAHALVLVPVGLGALPLLRRDRRPLLPLAIVGLQAAYVVWIGGDAWEGAWSGAIPVRADRFLAFAMPLVFIVANAELDSVLAWWRARRARDSGHAARWSIAAAMIVAVLGVVLANGLLGRDGRLQARMLLGIDRPPLTGRNAMVIEDLLRFERLVAPEATVGTAWAGIPAYFSDYRMVDLLGYNDRELARGPSAVPLDAANFRRFVPGHVKWDVRRALEETRPDAFFQIWEVQELGRPLRVMQRHGYEHLRGFWVRSDSPWIRWEDVPRAHGRRASPRAPAVTSLTAPASRP